MPDNNSRNGNNHRNANFRPGRKEKPKWTIMVYLGGDNNLTPNCIRVLQQLEAVQYSKDVCVLACFDSNTPWPKGSRYLAINCRRRSVKNCIDWEIHNDLIPPYDRDHGFKPPDFCNDEITPKAPPLKRTGVAEGLKRFLHWSMKNHDSERYMLILYGHGPLVAGKTFLVRENPQSSLLFQDLQKVLAPHFGPRRKLDILACQNCVMNGLETAYEVKDQVDVMIGSQGLVLTDGWPYEKIISAIVENPDATTRNISVNLLKACARHLIDFAVMDRSSEQSACSLRRLNQDGSIITAISAFVETMRKGMVFDTTAKGEKVLKYPTIVDAIRLARLEAQSYWGESFVDLYDFCERLLKKCNQAVSVNNTVLNQVGYRGRSKPLFRATRLVQLLTETIGHCMTVMEKIEEMVIDSYFIGAELQYSHGLSIFFPWTMPGEPYTFEETGNEYILKTAFESYAEYDFVKESNWANFLRDFFKATLRRVRRLPRKFVIPKTVNLNYGLVREDYARIDEVLTSDLQKSGSSSGYGDSDNWSYVKNYPRRNYLSPADCQRKISESGSHKPGSVKFPTETSPPVSYLGWNISGIVKEVISDRSKACNGNNGRAKSVRQRKTTSLVRAGRSGQTASAGKQRT